MKRSERYFIGVEKSLVRSCHYFRIILILLIGYLNRSNRKCDKRWMAKNKDVPWNTAVKRRNSAWRVLQDGTVSNIRDLLCPTFDSSSLFHSLFFSFLYLHFDFDLFSPYIPDNLYSRLHPLNFKERISLLTCIYRVKPDAHSSCFATESLAWDCSIYETGYDIFENC